LRSSLHENGVRSYESGTAKHLPGSTSANICNGSKSLIEEQENDASQKSSNMGPPRYAGGIICSTQHRESPTEKLKCKPKTQEHIGGQICKVEEKEDGNKGEHSGSRIENKVCSHDSCHSPACANGGKAGVEVGDHVNGCGNQTGSDIEEDVEEVPKLPFHIVTKDVEHPHIADEVYPAAMQEHGSKEGKDLIDNIYVGEEVRVRVPDGNHTILNQEGMKLSTKPKLVEKSHQTDRDDHVVDDWKPF
jgi:hypothetical protein